MALTTTIWYAAGLILLLLLLHLLAKPLEVALRVVGSSLIGGLALWLLNLAWGLAGFHIGLNPASALVVGLLGLPGLVGLGLLRLFLS